MQLRYLLVMLAALGAAACGDSDPLAGGDARAISPRTFVDIYVELRIAEHEAESEEDFEERSAAIFADHGTTPDGLHDFIERNGTNLELMSAVLAEIEERLRDPYPAPEPEADPR